MKKEKTLNMHVNNAMQIATYQAKLEDAVKASVKLHAASKALVALPTSYNIKAALMEINGRREHYDRVVRNTTHNIAVLELKEGI